MSLTFEHLSVVSKNRAKRWHSHFGEDDTDWTIADWSNAMCGEAGEMANVVKKIRRYETGTVGAQDPDLADLYEHLGQELADVVIYAVLVAQKAGIDLGSAVRAKFNAGSVREGFPDRL